MVLRLAPVLVANALVVTLFYRSFRRSAGGAPSTSTVGPGPGGTTTERSPARSPDTLQRPGSASYVTPARLSGVGLVLALFLIPFGLWLPALFVLAAFLVHIAPGVRTVPEEGRPATPWGFPVVGIVAVAALLAALGITLAL